MASRSLHQHIPASVPSTDEGALLAAFRRLSPPERAKALRIVLELETAAQRAAERFLLH